jgi:hypothetical protein
MKHVQKIAVLCILLITENAHIQIYANNQQRSNMDPQVIDSVDCYETLPYLFNCYTFVQASSWQLLDIGK